MATQGKQVFSVPGSNNQLKIELSWTSTQNHEDNYSNLNIQVIIHRGPYGYNTNSTRDKQTLWVGGKAHTHYNDIGGASNTSEVIQRVNYRMYHNNDGSMRFGLKFDKYFGVWWSGKLIGTKSFTTQNWDLPKLKGKTPTNDFLKVEENKAERVSDFESIYTYARKEEPRPSGETTSFIILNN